MSRLGRGPARGALLRRARCSKRSSAASIPVAQRVLYALLGAAVMAEVTLAINWWPTHGWTGGAVLLVCFFAVCGILTAHSERGTVRQRDLLEYGLVSLVGLVILAITL